MKCFQCGQRGTPKGMWWSPTKRNPFVVFVCRNAACLFEYINFDGAKAKGRPSWMTALRRVK